MNADRSDTCGISYPTIQEVGNKIYLYYAYFLYEGGHAGGNRIGRREITSSPPAFNFYNKSLNSSTIGWTPFGQFGLSAFKTIKVAGNNMLQFSANTSNSNAQVKSRWAYSSVDLRNKKLAISFKIKSSSNQQI